MELDIMTRFNHPNVMRCTKFYNYNNKIVTQMRLGKSLSDVIKHMNEKELFKVVYDIASGLSFLHNNLYHHCDIKMDNIVYIDNRAIIIDFSLLGTEESDICNTVYMRPLDLFNKTATSDILMKADSWALGCIIYQIITGDILFWNDSIAAVPNHDVGVLNAINAYIKNPDLYLQGINTIWKNLIKFFLVADQIKRPMVEELFVQQPYINYGWKQPLYNIIIGYAEYEIYDFENDMNFQEKTNNIINYFKLIKLPIKSIFTIYDLLYRLYPLYKDDITIYPCGFLAIALNSDYNPYIYDYDIFKSISKSSLYDRIIILCDYIINTKKEGIIMKTLYDDVYSYLCLEKLLNIIYKEEYYKLSKEKRLNYLMDMESQETKDEFMNRKPKQIYQIENFKNSIVESKSSRVKISLITPSYFDDNINKSEQIKIKLNEMFINAYKLNGMTRLKYTIDILNYIINNIHHIRYNDEMKFFIKTHIEPLNKKGKEIYLIKPNPILNNIISLSNEILNLL